MQLYQSKYLTKNDIEFYSNQKAEKMAVNMLKKNKYTMKEIAEATELTVERVKELKKQL